VYLQQGTAASNCRLQSVAAIQMSSFGRAADSPVTVEICDGAAGQLKNDISADDVDKITRDDQGQRQNPFSWPIFRSAKNWQFKIYEF
jgi:hypothetical protein